MVICTVFGCNNNNHKKLHINKVNYDSNSVKYNRFPQDKELTKIWVKNANVRIVSI